ncbi:MAG: glycosyltransferase family 2 protein [Oligoflexia bacterium]|nr:glycosyltransferase family 2 protein [Oligoflexia bacterium]
MSDIEREQYTVKNPVIFIVYNRPELTKLVFGEIKKVRPKTLFVIADGPKYVEQSELCQLTRDIINEIDWECEVYKNFSPINIGCRTRVSSGLSWAFEKTEAAIIIEDDIFPDPTFFRFCDEMLERYRDDERIMMISGTNVLQVSNGDNSYFFSRYPAIWGWATWRRAWKRYDVNLEDWPTRRKKKDHFKIFKNDNEAKVRATLWNEIYYDKFDTWDYQWDYCRFFNQGIGINPKYNLISNLGFGDHATHTKDCTNPMSNIPRKSLDFPMKHPEIVEVDEAYDDLYLQKFIYRPSWKIPLSVLKKKIFKTLRLSL